MTIQLASTQFGTSKATLQAALNSEQTVRFHDPSIFPGSRGDFNSSRIEVGEQFAVVMDPATRRRFATVKRTDKGFRVV